MFRAAGRKFALGIASAWLVPGVPADTVVLTGKEPFLHVSVTDIRRGRLVFRGVSGENLEKPLGTVAAITIDGLPELSAADAALSSGDFETALTRLADCEKGVREPWQRTLVRYRRLAVLSAAGRTDQALTVFLELVRDDPHTPAENLPADIGPAGASANRAALAQLRKLRLRGITPALENALAVRRLELTLLEDPDAAQRDFRPLDQDAPVAAAASQPSEEDDAPLLFGTPRAAPSSAPIALGRDSPLRKEVRRLIESGAARPAQRILERAAPFVRNADRGWWRLDAARCRIALGEHARAADELLAIAAAASAPTPGSGSRGVTSDRALSAWSLYYVGLAHEGLNRPDVAAEQYRELRGREDLPADVRREVEAAMERLKQ